MATITTTATAVPDHVLAQGELAGLAPAMFPVEGDELSQILALFARATVETRRSVIPPSRLPERRTLSQTMALYREHAPALAGRVAAEALDRAGLTAQEVDFLITVSCTGYVIPPLDAVLANALGMRPDVRRLPITELGCGGGGAALAYASDLVRDDPARKALVVAVELCTLHFLPGNAGRANAIMTAIFGDGAAAAVVTGRAAPGWRVLATRSHLVPATLAEMGFDLEDDGFHLILSKDMPDILHREVRRPLRALLEAGGVAEEDLSFFVVHPGGPKILERVEEALDLPRARTQISWDVLRSSGNVGAASVLFILDRQRTRDAPAKGAYGVLAAFGPGLSAELLLLQWC
jgi:alkylresorcinol/alkylpyrone synthase